MRLSAAAPTLNPLRYRLSLTPLFHGPSTVASPPLSIAYHSLASLFAQKLYTPKDTTVLTFSNSRFVEMPQIKSTIETTELEQQIFDDLLEVVKEANLTTTLRCAGGWVRDKLMGRQSLDIDIALDNMLGREFADKVNAHLKARVGYYNYYLATVPFFNLYL